MSKNQLIFTRHATIMLNERGIERAWVDLMLAEPEETEPDP